MLKQTFPEIIAAGWAQERPDLIGSGLNVTLRLKALAMEIDHQFAKIAAQEGVQLDDMLLLFALRRRGAPYRLRPTEICAMLNITSGAATYRIDRLVKSGLCEREPDPLDGRSYLLRVAAEGMRVIDRSVESVARSSTSALEAAGLGAAQLATFLELLRHVEQGWEAVIPEDENPHVRREGASTKSVAIQSETDTPDGTSTAVASGESAPASK